MQCPEVLVTTEVRGAALRWCGTSTAPQPAAAPESRRCRCGAPSGGSRTRPQSPDPADRPQRLDTGEGEGADNGSGLSHWARISSSDHPSHTTTSPVVVFGL